MLVKKKTSSRKKIMMGVGLGVLWIAIGIFVYKNFIASPSGDTEFIDNDFMEEMMNEPNGEQNDQLFLSNLDSEQINIASFLQSSAVLQSFEFQTLESLESSSSDSLNNISEVGRPNPFVPFYEIEFLTE